MSDESTSQTTETPRGRIARYPTRRAVVVCLAIGGLALGTVVVSPSLWGPWLVALAVFALVSGFDLMWAPRLDRVDVALTLPEAFYVGSACEIGVELRHSYRRPFRAALRLDVSEELPPADDRPGWTLAVPRSTATFTLTPRRRGAATLEALWLRTTGPFGLVAARRRVPLDRAIDVAPDLKGVSDDAIRLFTTRNLQSGVRVERHRGDGTEFDHLREYVPGFDIRSIDWKASARHGTMLVRELRAERNRNVLLAVDAGRLMGEPLEGLARLDHAIHAALTLAYVSLQVGDRVGFLAFDQRLRQLCPPVQGPAAMGTLTRTAAAVAYSTAETNFTLSLTELAQRQRQRALLVVFTDFVDTIAAELMVENLARLTTRHRVLFVALQDPSLEALAAAHPAGMNDLHRAVVAQRLVQDREVVLRRLQRFGVLCVDAPPREVSAALVDRYLEAKRRELF